MAAGRNPRIRTLLLGWLYADLLLVLFIAAMGNISAPDEPAAPVNARPEPTPSTAPGPRGLDPEPISFSVHVDRDRLLDEDGREQRALGRRVSRRLDGLIEQRARRDGADPHAMRVGLSITFGFDRSLGRAQQVARTSNRITRERRPRVFASAVMKSYGSLRPGNRVSYEIYLYR